MPTYQYRCEQCAITFEQTETISEHEVALPGNVIVKWPWERTLHPWPLAVGQLDRWYNEH